MENTKDEWMFFKDIDWNDSVQQVHVDTRDFHALVLTEPSDIIPDLSKIINYSERFFHTTEEVKDLVDRYFNESGGERQWRSLFVVGINDWFKYMRIFKTEHGWLICDRERHALGKYKLSGKVIQNEL